MKLTILGLGPGHPDDLTRRAWRILEAAPVLALRTARHPVVAALEREYISFDALYDAAEDFNSLYEAISAEVLALAHHPQGVVYAVPGHPLVGEQTVTHLLARAGDLKVEIIDGLSFIEPSLSLLGIDGMAGLQIHDAAELAIMHHPPLNPDQPALIGQLYSAAVASDVKLTLMNQYPDEHPAILLHSAGLPEAIREEMPLYAIDRSPHISHLTTLYLPPLPQASSFEALQEIMAHLRAPEGCPWDRKQTRLSLRPFLLEEAYEVLEALDADDTPALIEELGDLLLQIVFHAQIATDEGEFQMAEVIAGINSKLIRRHPHVWGDVQADDPEAVLAVWQTQKDAEKAANGGAPKGILGDTPKGLPALLQAEIYQRKAAKVGFDWDQIDPLIAKIFEEIEEIKTAPNDEERAKEIGDLLFAVVNWARWLGVDPEIALRGTNGRFKARFAYIEAQAIAQGRNISSMSLAEMDALWEVAKNQS